MDVERFTNITEPKLITCMECGLHFEFEVGEQRYYLTKGLAEPKRCRPCRERRKMFIERRD